MSERKIELTEGQHVQSCLHVFDDDGDWNGKPFYFYPAAGGEPNTFLCTDCLGRRTTTMISFLAAADFTMTADDGRGDA